jgi:aspartokinase/homoserine dehydrogenase 1
MSVNDTSTVVRRGFAGHSWFVHKFGGTSVANADCFLACAAIVESQLFSNKRTNATNKQNLAVVVSAMGGTPKTTDLLLDAVTAAAQRNAAVTDEKLQLVLDKHHACVSQLFASDTSEQERLLLIIKNDIRDIQDILKTVSLMKWQAERISELISGYGELWSAQILTALLLQRVHERQEQQALNGIVPSTPRDNFVYMDARRVITIDEDAIHDGAVAWDASMQALENVYAQETTNNANNETILHFVITGYVASNTNGVATTLKRDGSDYSAAIMGKLLSSNSITIWTDVDGVLSADPRRVPSAQVLPEVCK